MKEKRNATKSPQNVSGTGLVWLFWILLSTLMIPYLINRSATGPKEISWREFEVNMLHNRAVAKLQVVNNEMVQVFIKPQLDNSRQFKEIMKSTGTGPQYFFQIGSVESFEQKLEAAQKDLADREHVDVLYVKRKNWLQEIFFWVLPFALLVLTWFFIMNRVGGSGTGGASIFNFGKSTATLQDIDNKSTVTFDDVAGLDEAKAEVKEVVDFLQHPADYTQLGAKIPKGVIIVGPPGTGKTLLVKAVAGEAGVPFFSMSGAGFVEMFVGVGASRVRDLFKRAKEKAPCIVFIDEIDAVGRSRGKDTLFTGANDERESTLNQLLTEMDGFSTNSGVIVLAATNRADMLDPALLRPGRFDRHIYLELPNLSERKAIFEVHLKPLALDDAIDVDFLAAQTPGFSGADIANICNEAALIAARQKKKKVGRQDFLDAIDRIVAGLERKSKIISPTEKKMVAFHEAGHVVVSWLLTHTDPLLKVSIIPRGRSLGEAWYLPEERQLKTVTEFREQLCVALGGRAAEEVVFGEVSSGALDDLEKVTREAYMMVAYYGFNKEIGNMSFYDSTASRGSQFTKPYSEETGRLIDEETRKLVNNAYEEAKTLLMANRNGLDAIADRLLEKEVIFKEDIETILGKRKAPQTPIPS
ncbi:ATP-dependent zinc metalloprotease FtsH [Chitinophaga filiformis]|uniref:ATP-dependent zinc metalloprotease FtsH n=1 Tax=Chitinophaga filiformis TaxID=104663 RepID=UPI001F229A9A|nr:ATP-dependent zinc metalloprotease FtsH [Chitinophaga filiformis]MCF6405329.1 ATP-dependent zinc metalloprotease FtsH [Chitinophaga filiformis]